MVKLMKRPVPSRVLASMLPDENEMRAYLRTSTAIGFEPAALLEIEILRCFQKHGIKQFDYDAVSAYMTAYANHVKQEWYWRPLRQKDHVDTVGWGIAAWHGLSHDWYDADDEQCSPYPRAVPLRVLATVEKIVEAVPSALFFVTDLATSRPDPFICVTAPNMSRIVFDVWDEPGFAG